MAKIVLRNGIKLLGTLESGVGDNILTRDSTDNSVGSISPVDPSAYLTTSLSDGNILLGSNLNVATARVVTGDVTISNLGVTSITADSITNADINTAAGIAYSKLELTGTIVNNDIATSANISRTKIAAGSAYRVLINNNLGVFSEASTITAARVLISDANGIPTHSTITSTTLAFLDASSSIQTQINNKLSFSSGISPSDGDIIYYGSGSWTNLAAGADGEVLTLASGLPSWTAGVSNGLPSGGTTDQYLRKIDATNYNVEWGTLTLSDVTDVTATVADVNLLDGLNAAGVTNTELLYINGVTSNIQSQLTGKQDRALAYNALWVGNVSGIPIQLGAGTNGYVLTSVSGVPQWQPSVAGFASPMTTEGDLILGDTGGAAIRLGIGTPGQVLTSDGTTASWGTPPYASSTLPDGNILVGNVSNIATSVTMSGDVTINNTGVTTIGAGAVGYSKLASSATDAFWKVTGNSTLTGNTAIIGSYRLDLGTTANKLTNLLGEVGGVGSTILFTQSHSGVTRRVGMAEGLGFILDVGSDATGDIYQRNASGVLSRLASVATGNVLLSGGVATVNSWGKVGLSTHVSGILPVTNGGTGSSSFSTTNGVVTFNGSSLVTSASFQILGGGSMEGTTHDGTSSFRAALNATGYRAGFVSRNINTGSTASSGFSASDTSSGSAINGGHLKFTSTGYTEDSNTGVKQSQLILENNRSVGTGGILLWANGTTPGQIQFSIGSGAGSLKATMNNGGFGLGTITPTALLHIAAGTATAGTAPLKLTTGTALTTPEDGALEYHSSHLYFTIGSTRYQLDQQGGGGSVATDTIWDAAGDLAIGTGSNTAARLAIGAATQVLTSNGTTAAWSYNILQRTEPASTYTIQNSDLGYEIIFSNSSGCVVTIPNTLSVDSFWFSATKGTAMTSGDLSFVASSTTLNTIDSELTISEVSGSATWRRVGATSAWYGAGAFGTGGGGGISNTAANNELAKSDGTDIGPSGLFSTTAGDLTLGTGLAGVTRTVLADSSGSNSSLVLQSKGSGYVSMLSNDTSLGVNGSGSGASLSRSTAGTNSLQSIMTYSLTGGTVSNGFGMRFLYDLEIPNGSPHEAGQVHLYWEDSTLDSEDSRYKIQTVTAGSLGDTLSISGGVSTLTSTNLTVTGAIYGYGALRSRNSGGDEYTDIYPTAILNYNTTGTKGTFSILSASGASGSINGDDLLLQSGTGELSTNGNGGNVFLEAGAGEGSGVQGRVYVNHSAGFSSGEYIPIDGINADVTESADFTLTEQHRGKLIYCNKAGTQTVTMPTGFLKGWNTVLIAWGATTVIATSGTVVGKTATTAQYETLALTHSITSETYLGI